MRRHCDDFNEMRTDHNAFLSTPVCWVSGVHNWRSLIYITQSEPQEGILYNEDTYHMSIGLSSLLEVGMQDALSIGIRGLRGVADEPTRSSNDCTSGLHEC